jgi:hypothetical protein
MDGGCKLSVEYKISAKESKQGKILIFVEQEDKT